MRGLSSRPIISSRTIWVVPWSGHWTWTTFEVNSVAKENFQWSKRSKPFCTDSWNCYRKRRSARLVQLKNTKVCPWIEIDRNKGFDYPILGLKSQPPSQPQTTEKTTKKPKKSKRDAEGPSNYPTVVENCHTAVFLAPEDVCEELKDGQWPDPSDCKSYFLCRGVGSQWGEQKREVCYAGKTEGKRHKRRIDS